uniref:histidine kinase n=1 Tax=Solibacter usitatus (strain Ellin6076) TaxID=234267 RepID=Q025N6_SOLUE
MSTPNARELSLKAEVRRVREDVANLGQGCQRDESAVEERDLQSFARVRVLVPENSARHTGLTMIGDVPWGTHFCQFYEGKQDLIDILVPYFKAGLENNEFCMWVTSEPLRSAQAKAALAASVENLDAYIADGKLEILDYSDCYTLGGKFESDRALQGLIDRVETAPRRGFAGLRISGNTLWLEKSDWQAFTEYEAAVNAVIGKYRMLALCTYSLSNCGAIEIMDVISNHAFALMKRAGKWERIDSAERKKVGVSLLDSEERLRMAIASTGLGTWDFDVASGSIMSSDLCKHHFGLSLEREFDYDIFLHGIHTEDRERVDNAVREALRPGSVGHFHAEYRTVGIDDGQERWITDMGRAFLDLDGQPLRFIGVTLDITERKRSEEELRRSEARWNAAIENLESGVIIATDTEQVIYRNPAALAMHGFPSDQRGLGTLQDMTSIFQLWTPDGRLLTLDDWPLRRIKRGETLNHLELRLCRLDQRWEKIISYSGALVETAIGERLMFVSAQNLTDQRNAEHALRESEERLRLLGDHLPDSAVYQYVDELGVPGRYTYFSAGLERLNGVTVEGVLRDKSTLHSQILPEHLGRFMEAKSRSRRDLSDFDIEVPMRRGDGEICWIHFHSRPRRLPDGRTVWDGVQTDVTAHKQAKDALKKQAELLRLSYDGMIVWKLDGTIENWNIGAERLYGYSETEAVGKLTHALLAPQFPKPWGEILKEMRIAGSWEGELRQQTRDGSEVVVSARIQLIKGSDGIDRVLEVNRDITDAKRAQFEAFARQKLESLGTLASGIAHDFNNLLGAVLAQAELAASGLAAGASPHEELETIKEVAIRGSDIVRQLMIYAGTESDVLEPIEISKTVEEMYSLLKAAISKRVTLVTDLGEHVPAVQARTAQLRQVLMNLVVNASDAIKGGGGVIRVTTRCVTLNPNSAGTTAYDLADGDYVELEVSDTGSGMPHDIQARIFDPFFSTKSPGRGLGLAVIHGIVRSLRGVIRVESEVGKGTTFRILLPSVGTAARETRETTGREELHGSSDATVLIVEDEAPLRVAVKKMLGKAGFTVLEAADGAEAVKLLHSTASRIDLLLLDMTIPGCSSDEVLREGAESWPQMKVILTSAYSEESVNGSMSAPQVRGFVRKPFRLGTLLSALRTALSS